MSYQTIAEEEQTLPPVRSTFLTVLCVLTFLGSAYGIFSGFSQVITAEKVVKITNEKNSAANREEAKKELSKKNDPWAKLMIRMMDSVKDLNAKNIKMAGAGTAIASVITLLGALLMWRLKRNGFYLYIVGVIASVAVPLIVFGTNNILAALGAVIPAFFGVVFIAMYAFNLRDMK